MSATHTMTREKKGVGCFSVASMAVAVFAKDALHTKRHTMKSQIAFTGLLSSCLMNHGKNGERPIQPQFFCMNIG
ncbi:hypothetical protein [Polynucleobacter sp.]|uniref:hypothetical protein n=1 Tax=Polynucleobacter sp. TaxID=2029855 RepID=UPI003F69F896